MFVAFQSWALYFLREHCEKRFKRLSWILYGDCIREIVMLKVGGMLGGLGIFAIPVTALIIVPIMMYFEYAPFYISDVATFFVGAGAFYGIYNYVDGITINRHSMIEMLYCVLGLASGWMTVLFRNWYENKQYHSLK